MAQETLKLADAVRLQRGADITKLPLGAQEGFILSRIEGRTVIRDLVASTGLGQDAVLDTVNFLQSLGVIHKDFTPVEEEEDGDAPEGPPESLPAELASEQNDLSPEQRLRIVQAEYHCGKSTYYDVLGLKRSASAAEVKRAYHQVSREFHPDAFFRKNLGTFKARLEKIFKHVKHAYDVLSDDDTRREYDRKLPPEVVAKPKPQPGASPSAPAAPAAPEWKPDPRRVKEAEERRLRRNPMVQRVDRARRHLQRAKELLAAKQLAQAANEIGLAVALDPWNEEIQQVQEKISADVREQKFARAVARIELLTAGGGGLDPEKEGKELAEAVREAMEMQGASAPIYWKLGRTLFKAGHAKLAKGPADRAFKLAPEDDKVLLLMVDLLEDAGLHHNALRTLEKAQQLHPAADKQERIVKLRKVADRK